MTQATKIGFCPYCSTDLRDSVDGTQRGYELVVCTQCLTQHYALCWKSNSVCTTYGCGSTTATALAATHRPAPPAIIIEDGDLLFQLPHVEPLAPAPAPPMPQRRGINWWFVLIILSLLAFGFYRDRQLTGERDRAVGNWLDAKALKDDQAATSEALAGNLQALSEVIGAVVAAERVQAPLDGSMEHDPASGKILDLSSDSELSLRNFVAEVTLYNPYGPDLGAWDYGISFRQTGPAQGYWFILDSTGAWELMLADDAGEEQHRPIEASGQTSNLDLSANGANQLRLVVSGDKGWVIVNGTLTAQLDISSRSDAGSIWVGSGYYGGREVAGYTTRVEDFTLWKLP